MKKFLLIIFVNLIIFSFLIVGIDFIVFVKNNNEDNYIYTYKLIYKELLRHKSEKELSDKYIRGITNKNEDFYRPVVNKESALPPILLFGCSFVYGYNIPDDKIFSEVLGRYTNRPIYNRAKDGLGPSLMLYQLQSEDFYKIIPEPEYVIYTYINDHPRRMFHACVPSIPYYYDIFYKLNRNGKLSLRKFVNKIYFIELLRNNFYLKKNLFENKETHQKNYSKKSVELFRAQILESNRLIKEHWKNTKFIIFVYTIYDISPIGILRKEFEENGIKVIYRGDIAPFNDFDKRYTLAKRDNHPNEHAWEYITPRLMKEIEKEL